MSHPIGATSPAFEIAHPFIKKWEGGFVHHPNDPGGATNFGITRATLSAWRGTKASIDDVKTMSINEAKKIYFTHYWLPLHADEMPISIALMTYNAAVNSGPSRGVKLLQKALNNLGHNIAIDGKVGQQTLAALNTVDERALVAAFAKTHENFYRRLKHFSTFGNGWINRLNDIAASARHLIGETRMTDVKPQILEPSQSNRHEQDPIIQLLRVLLANHLKPQTTAVTHSTDTARLAHILEMLANPATLPNQPKGRAPLTPVNNALGETIGALLNGKKTGLGSLGLLLTAILPIFFPAQLAPLGSLISIIGEAAQTAPFKQALASDTGLSTKLMAALQPLLLGITGWGILGKMDKWSQPI